MASPLHHVCVQVNSEALRKACPIPFHEGRLWKSADAADLKRQLQTHFRNITSIMDCVGCEKCKLWGKLQLLGMGTLNWSAWPMAQWHQCTAPGYGGQLSSAVSPGRLSTLMTAVDTWPHCGPHD